MSHPKTAEKASNREPRLDVRDTEVVAKAKRRQFSLAYKTRILTEVDNCTEAGQIGAILRREGLYSSHLTTWRRQWERGELAGRRGRPARSDAEPEVNRLRQENERLQQRLAQAEAIIDVQKKVSQLIGLSLNSSPQDAGK